MLPSRDSTPSILLRQNQQYYAQHRSRQPHTYQPSCTTAPAGPCRSIVEVAAYNAVKGATCQKRCLDGGLIQACPASLPSAAPGPGSSAASLAQGAFVLPNGSLSTAYGMGSLPRGSLSSALQTGAPPRHPRKHVPEVQLRYPDALSCMHVGLRGSLSLLPTACLYLFIPGPAAWARLTRNSMHGSSASLAEAC